MKAWYSNALLRQFVYELDEWGRLLAFFMQENSFYKSRLADMVSTIDDSDFLVAAESFNDDFLSQDRIIEFLSEELKKHDKLLQEDFYVDGALLKDVIKNQKRLRTDIQKAEEIFSKTKRAFSNYLSSIS